MKQTWSQSSPDTSASRTAIRLDFFLKKHRGLRGAPQGAGDGAERADRHGQGLGPARPRRRRVPDRHEVGLRRSEVAEAEVHRLQRRRERARHVQGPRADGAQPAPAVRGLPDRLLGDPREGRLHLHPRRVLPRAADHGSGAEEGLRRGLRRQEHHGQRVGLRHRHPPRRRRLRGGRRDRADRVARGQARAAAHQAAVPGGRRSLRLPDCRQQRRDALQPAADPAERRRVVRRPRPREERRTRSCIASAATCRSPASTKRR